MKIIKKIKNTSFTKTNVKQEITDSSEWKNNFSFRKIKIIFIAKLFGLIFNFLC